MKKGKQRKWPVCVSVVLAALCILAGTVMPVQAATTTGECIGVVGIMNDSGEVDMSTAVAINVNGNFVVISNPFGGNMESMEAVYLTGTGNQYMVSYVEGFAEWDLAGWILDPNDEDNDSAAEDPSFLEPGDPHQDEVALIVYYENGTNDLKASGVTLLELDGSGTLTLDQYPDNAQYPASLVNENGELLGICRKEGIVYAVKDGTGFYGGGSGTPQTEPSQAPTTTPQATAPPLPARESGPSGAQEKPSGTASSEPEPTEVPPMPMPSATPLPDDPGPDGVSVIVWIGIAVIIAVIAAVIVFVGRRKKKDPGVQDEAPKLWLAARGGCLNGCVYPVGQDEITIGRDAACVIRYPADTVGVSRAHAKLYLQDGRLMLMDLSSTSGTFLQGQGKLTPMVPVEVRTGDSFYIGETINSFEIRD